MTEVKNMEILIPVLILLGIAVICAVLLTVASVFFGVKEDETAIAIRECLPGANCGACGYNGCDAYAKALAENKADATNLCVPGGDKVSREISAILGVEALDVEEMVAYVACNGTCGVSEQRYEYQGPRSCIAANLHYSGSKLCKDACLGYGDCAAACPKDAIYIEDGVAHVDSSECIGCGICVRTCPNAIIKLIPEVAKVTVNCSNHDKGALTRKYCANGCIGCMKCEKACPSGAIKVQNNVATIDYSLCTSCKECVKVCPVKCIHEGCFLNHS